MTPEQQRISIAEACGWKWERQKIDGHIAWTTPTGGEGYNVLPDYFHDLNTMREAKNVLTDGQRMDYLERLANACESILPWKRDWHCCHASASQRAEAFLRTIGKWVD